MSVTNGATLAAQSSWTVDVDGKGTPADPSDDVYTIDGAQQGAGAGSGADGGAGDAHLGRPRCVVPRQPDRRHGRDPGGRHSSTLEEVVVTFHAKCDGKVDVKGTLGGTHAQKLMLFQ